MRKRALEEMDANGDGRITEDEWTGPVPFARLDRNGDGALTQEDIPDRRQGGRNRDPQVLRRRFDEMDRDGNGILSGDEVLWPDMLTRLDADGDGGISFDEFQEAMKRRQESQRKKPGDAKPSSETTTPPDQPVRIAVMDKDGNGKLSRNEFPGPDEAWRRLDRNRDGWISQDELSGGRRRPGNREPQGPPPPQED
jgi:Ca2+-binding EF-hand superfamily protein